jgi:hypothetical protein
MENMAKNVFFGRLDGGDDEHFNPFPQLSR